MERREVAFQHMGGLRSTIPQRSRNSCGVLISVASPGSSLNGPGLSCRQTAACWWPGGKSGQDGGWDLKVQVPLLPAPPPPRPTPALGVWVGARAPRRDRVGGTDWFVGWGCLLLFSGLLHGIHFVFTPLDCPWPALFLRPKRSWFQLRCAVGLRGATGAPAPRSPRVRLSPFNGN